jgi:hypothetical protein
MMRRGVLIIVLAVVLGVGPGAAVAFGWANGPEVNGVKGNGFGTHDWILAHAVEIAGEDGEWLDRDRALRATDDPDSLDDPSEMDTLNHIYNLTRTGCGAPQKIADLYYAAVCAYREGDVRAASAYVGQLSHYYADICQPYHTYWDPNDSRIAADHLKYEYGVDFYHRDVDDVASWITEADRRPVSDVRARAVSAAKAARADYPELKSAIRRSGFSASSGSTVGSITRRRLSRAANDLADIIATIPTGEGCATSGVFTTVVPTRRYPYKTTTVGINAKVTDPSGKPLEGVKVNFVWEYPTKTVTTVSYSRSDGVATTYRAMSTAPANRTITVVAKQRTNAVKTSKSTWVKRR